MTKFIKAKIANLRKTTDSRRAPCNIPTNHPAKDKEVGLLNIGNTCYMNSVMQCLSSIVAFAEYFKGGEYCNDIDPKSKYGGVFARGGSLI